jgi:UrcA family protein
MKSTFASRFTLIGMTTIALGVGVSHASTATPDQDAPKIVVRYAGLDLTQPRDAQRLYRRIQTAAQLVCENYKPEGASGLTRYQACINNAVARAVEDVNSTQVTEIHEAGIQHAVNRS